MELLARIQQIEKILTSTIAKKDKVIQSFQTLSGLELNRLNTKTRRARERNLVTGNQILQQYPIVTFDDYCLISDPHLDKLLAIIRKNCDCLLKFIATSV